MIDTKDFPLTIKAADDQQGVIEAIVSVTGNVDRGGDRVMPGFFAKSLRKKLPAGVWSHDWTKPIAKTLSAEEWRAGDPRLPDSIRGYGAYVVKAQFVLGVQAGREAYELIKARVIDEFSIGFVTVKHEFNQSTQTRDLLEGEWFEWSPVLRGMNPETQVIRVKSEQDKLALAQFESDYAKHMLAMAELAQLGL
jgi:Escherichia/Staphylococcus phage prohead protease